MSIENDFDLDTPEEAEPAATEALPAPIVVIQYRYPSVSRILIPVLLVAAGIGLLSIRDRLRSRLEPVLARFAPKTSEPAGRKIFVSPSEVKTVDPVVLWKDPAEIEADKAIESAAVEQAKPLDSSEKESGTASADTSKSIVDSLVNGENLFNIIKTGEGKPAENELKRSSSEDALTGSVDRPKTVDHMLKSEETASIPSIAGGVQTGETKAADESRADAGEPRRILVPPPAGSIPGALVIIGDRGAELVRRDALNAAGARPKTLASNMESRGRTERVAKPEKPLSKLGAGKGLNTATGVARSDSALKPSEKTIEPAVVKPEPGSNGLAANAEDLPHDATGDKRSILEEIRRDSERKEAERLKLLDRKQNGPTRQERAAERRARMERLEQAAIEADRERVRFFDELKSVVDRFGARSAPAIRKLEEKYGRHTQPEISNEAKEVIGPNVPIDSTSHTIHRLRVIGLPETLILDHLNDRQMTFMNARNGPSNADDALVRAARILLKNPIVKSSAASDGRRAAATARKAG
jgi:hypothetical protein